MNQLGMTSDEYNLVTVLYYVCQSQIICLVQCLTYDKIPYIIGEAPSNLLLKYFTPSKWQSRIIVTWGICLMLHAAVHNKGGLYATRFFLGLVCFSSPVKTGNLTRLQAESGQFAGILLQMCYWYRPDEMSLRLLYFCEFTAVLCSLHLYLSFSRHLWKCFRNFWRSIGLCI